MSRLFYGNGLIKWDDKTLKKKIDCERTAQALPGAMHFYPASVCLNDGFDDCQLQPAPARFTTARFIPTIESVKYRVDLFLLQPLTGICYRDADALIIGGSPQDNFSTRLGMAQAMNRRLNNTCRMRSGSALISGSGASCIVSFWA